MLRVGRGLGRTVTYAHLSRHIRVPTQPIPQRRRLYSTTGEETTSTKVRSETPKADGSDSTTTTTTTTNTQSEGSSQTPGPEQRLALRRARSLRDKTRNHEARLEALERSRAPKASLSKERSEEYRSQSAGKVSQEPAEETSDNFNAALGVVRKVYRTERGLSRNRRRRSSRTKKPAAKNRYSPTPQTSVDVQDQFTSADDLYREDDQPADAANPARKTGIWTTLRERLQQMADGPASVAQSIAPFAQLSEQHQDVANKEPPMVNNSKTLKDSAGDSDPKDAKKKKKKRSDTSKEAKNDPGPAKAQPKAKRKISKVPLDVKTIRPAELKLTPIKSEEALDIPQLAHNLDRVLFNPGVYELQDQRSRVYNFDPYLSSIMPNDEFDFNALGEYITSSKDTKLRDLSAEYGLKYCGSTSSLTSLLAHFHFLISNWRRPFFGNLSRDLDIEFETFSAISRGPAAAFARLKDGVYAIDADKEFDTENILSMLGKSMEKLLTLPKEEFEKYRLSESHQLPVEDKQAGEAYHYTTAGDFMLRSQIDAHDPRLPGTGTFDLKTRAVVSIRMDVAGYEKGQDYEISERTGTWSSYEREYYDMIRTAFLKYSLQVRMGRMDGIFVAFHNTRRIFGFQYVSLEEMDRALHGTTNRRVGDEEFRASLALFNDVMNRATERFPGKSLRIHLETRPTDPPLTYFFAEPVSEELIEKTQESGKASADEIKSEILEIRQKELQSESDATGDEPMSTSESVDESHTKQPEANGGASEDITMEEDQSESAWDELMAKVDETVENESSGLQAVRDAIQEALAQSGLLRGKSKEETEVYLNSLVEALKVELSDNRELNDESENADEEVDDTPYSVHLGGVNQPETADPAISSTSDSSADITTPAPAMMTQDGVAAQEAVVDDISSENRASETSDIQQGDIPPGDNQVNAFFNANELTRETPTKKASHQDDDQASSNMRNSGPDSSLKDLIIKVAEEADNKTGSMGTFERVLSDLAAQSKQADVTSDDLGPDDENATESSGNEGSKPSRGDLSSSEPDTEKRELFGAYITVRNKHNGKYVDRVELPDSGNQMWDIQYAITELPEERALRIYKQLKGRRRKVLSGDPASRSEKWHQLWRGKLAEKSKSGADFRRKMEKKSRGNPVYAAWAKEPIQMPSTGKA